MWGDEALLTLGRLTSVESDALHERVRVRALHEEGG